LSFSRSAKIYPIKMDGENFMQCKNKKCRAEIDDSFRFCPHCGKAQEPQRRRSARRGNGSGSVYKRADLKACPWVAVTPAEYDDEGNRTTKVIGYFRTAQEATDALEEYRKHPTTKIDITVAEVFAEWSGVAYKEISKQTQDNYDAAWKKLSAISELRFRDLRTAQMQQQIDRISEMSLSTLSKVKALLTQLYDYAVQNDIIDKNYAKFIRLPKKEKTKKDCFSDIELKKVEQAVGTVPFADVILMMCYTGFRVSEFLSLTVHSYDPVNRTLTGGMKTDAGKDRVVPVHPKIRPLLETWLAKGGETIICREDGSKMTADYFRRQCYYPALEQTGVRRLSPHATRHTFATRLSAAGVRTENIQQLCGHEDYSMTANVYVHQNVDELRKAIEAMA